MKDSISELRKERMRKTRIDLMTLFFEMPKEPKPSDFELKQEPKERRFGELAKKSGLSDAGLFKILKELVNVGELVKKDDENGRPVYTPSRTAIEKAQKNIWYLANELQELRDAHALYWHGGDFFYGLFDFGFSTDIATSNQIPGNIITGVLEGMEERAFRSIVNNLKNTQQTVRDHSNGKMILALEIDLHKFEISVRKIQSFIEDINFGRPVFSDDLLDLKNKDSGLFYLDFLIRFSPLFGDNVFERKLKTFLKTFSTSYDFYDITQVNPKLFDEFMGSIDYGNTLKNKKLFKKLLVPVRDGAGHVDYFSRYIIAARITRYGDLSFIKKLNEFILEKDKKWRSMTGESVERKSNKLKMVKK